MDTNQHEKFSDMNLREFKFLKFVKISVIRVKSLSPFFAF